MGLRHWPTNKYYQMDMEEVPRREEQRVMAQIRDPMPLLAPAGTGHIYNAHIHMN